MAAAVTEVRDRGVVSLNVRRHCWMFVQAMFSDKLSIGHNSLPDANFLFADDTLGIAGLNNGAVVRQVECVC